MKCAGTNKEISCIIGNLFLEIEPPCKACIEGKDTISITGTTNTGRKTTIHIENKGDGIFYVEDEVAEEVNEIRCGRCVYEYKLR